MTAAATLAVASVLAGGRARAASTCVVSLSEAGEAVGASDARWTDAAQETSRMLAERAGDDDCASIDIVPRGRGADVVFHTRDGRSAERFIERPSELQAVVEALLVRDPSAGAPADASIAREQSAPPPPAFSAAPGPMPIAPSDPAPVAVASTRSPRLRASVDLGGKLAWPNGGAAAFVQAGASVPIGIAEVGALARWEPGYSPLETEPRGFELEAVGAGLQGGARPTVGPLQLVVGGSVLVYSVLESVSDPAVPHHHQRLTRPFTEPRLGAHVGCVVPIFGVRLRPQLNGEVALADPAVDPRFPELPDWSVGLTLGAEAELFR